MPNSIYSFPNNIRASVKLDLYGSLLDLLSGLAYDIDSLCLSYDKNRFSDIRSLLISSFLANDTNSFKNTLHNCKIDQNNHSVNIDYNNVNVNYNDVNVNYISMIRLIAACSKHKFS